MEIHFDQLIYENFHLDEGFWTYHYPLGPVRAWAQAAAPGRVPQRQLARGGGALVLERRGGVGALPGRSRSLAKEKPGNPLALCHPGMEVSGRRPTMNCRRLLDS